MSDQDVANNWRLEETGETNDRWKLQPAEQNAVKPWQLQDERQPETPWQPVDYARERNSAGNWILPGLVIIALIAVLGYVGWIGLTRFGLLTPTAQVSNQSAVPTTSAANPATDTKVANAPAVKAATVPTLTLTTAPTQPPPETPTAVATATPAPTIIVHITQEFVSVNDPAGVNARSEPNTTSAVVKLLEPGQRLLVVQQNNDWVQVALAKGSLAWVKAEVVDHASQQVTVDEANQRRSELGLAPLSAEEAQALAQALAPATGVTNTATSTITSGVTAPLTTTQPSAVRSVTATINITGGLNARVTPSTDAITIKLLTDGARYKVTGRSADKQWLQVVLEDGTVAWVFAQFVNVTGDVDGLATPPATSSPTPTGTITRTLTVSPTRLITGSISISSTTNPKPTSPQASGATATISSLSGANARPTTDRTAKSVGLFPFEAVLPVVGRSADSQWVQVKLEDGKLAWMLTSAVKVSSGVATLPIVNP